MEFRDPLIAGVYLNPLHEGLPPGFTPAPEPENGRKEVVKLLDLLNHLYRLKGLSNYELQERSKPLINAQKLDSKDLAQIPILKDRIKTIKMDRDKAKDTEAKVKAAEGKTAFLNTLVDYRMINCVEFTNYLYQNTSVEQLREQFGDPGFVKEFIANHLKGENNKQPRLIDELSKAFKVKFPRSKINDHQLQELAIDIYIKLAVAKYQQVAAGIKINYLRDSLNGEKSLASFLIRERELKELANAFFPELSQAMMRDFNGIDCEMMRHRIYPYFI